MTIATLWPLVPLLIPSAAAVIALTALGLARRHALIFGITVLGLGLGIGCLPLTPFSRWISGNPLLVFDNFAQLFLGLIYSCSLVVALLLNDYLRQKKGRREEAYLLLLTATVGAAVLAMSTHFISLFLGLEILSVSLYALIAYQRDQAMPVEAGIKYLVLAAGSAAFLLFGMALIYLQTGTMQLNSLSKQIYSPSSSLVMLTGLIMVMVGIGFKLALVPFHLWAADIYQGASSPITALVATVSKTAVLAVFTRYFLQVEAPFFQWMVAIIAIASMLIGNLLALLQDNIKRLLAYSSIAHLGYILVSYLARGANSVPAIFFYLLAYNLALLIALGVVSRLSEASEEADQLAALRGLAWRCPWLAAGLVVSLFSLAGIPFTAGFVGKFYVMANGVQARLWLVLCALLAGSAIGLYYYLRVIVMVFFPAGPGIESTSPVNKPVTSLVLGVLLVLVVGLGTIPGPLLTLIDVLHHAIER